jgi:hypothetical protein
MLTPIIDYHSFYSVLYETPSVCLGDLEKLAYETTDVVIKTPTATIGISK